MRLKDLIGKKITVHQSSGKFRPALIRDIDTNKQLQVDYLDNGIVTGGSVDINKCFYNDRPLREIINKNISLTEALIYLKEELGDIPARADNIHLTDFEGLYYILQSGLQGQKGGYTIHSPKTKKNDMELATTRNTHKLTNKEKSSLSKGAEGGVKINLFTDRILTGHRGTRKDKIAELPQQRKRYIDNDKTEFKKKYGFDMPDFTEGPNHELPKGFNEDYVQKWLLDNKKSFMNNIVTNTIYHHNYDIQEYYKELRNREREERFILKKSIPTKPEFMSIVIEKKPEDISDYDKDFIDEVAPNYLKLLEKHSDVIIDNKNLRLFKNYLRDLIK